MQTQTKKRTFAKEDNINRNSGGLASVKSQAIISSKKKLKLEEEEEELDLNGRLMKYKELESIFKRTNIKPIYLMYLLVFLIVLIIFGVWEDLLTCVIGVTYPLYISIKTIRANDRDQVKQWLTYWVVFSIFMNLESIFGFLLKYIPLYFFYKTVFLLICFLPQYNGAKWLYEIIIKDIFMAYEADVYDFSVSFSKKLTTINEEN